MMRCSVVDFFSGHDEISMKGACAVFRDKKNMDFSFNEFRTLEVISKISHDLKFLQDKVRLLFVMEKQIF